MEKKAIEEIKRLSPENQRARLTEKLKTLPHTTILAENHPMLGIAFTVRDIHFYYTNSQDLYIAASSRIEDCDCSKVYDIACAIAR